MYLDDQFKDVSEINFRNYVSYCPFFCSPFCTLIQRQDIPGSDDEDDQYDASGQTPVQTYAQPYPVQNPYPYFYGVYPYPTVMPYGPVYPITPYHNNHYDYTHHYDYNYNYDQHQ